jgi:hypothetical protein
MNHRNDHPGEFPAGNPGFQDQESNPDQYGREQFGRKQYGPQQHAEGPGGPGQRQYGHSPYGENQYGGGREYRGGGADYGSHARPEHTRGYSAFSQAPFSQQPSGHAPFGHAAFGESNEPRYFGAGSQGHGGGPSFTGGTYGNADQRSDSPYFQEAGFNRGYYEDPIPRPRESYPYPRAFGTPRARLQRRRYPMGPKGYQRSDERLREDISERLMEAYEVDSSEVTVQVLGGKVVLEGTVPDRYMKHAIEDLADAAPGVQDVDNRIRVASRTSSGPGDTGHARGARDMGQSSSAGVDTGSKSTRRDS